MKKFILPIASVLLITGSLFVANAHKGGDKVTICHQTGNGTITIEVNESALSAHIAHGDLVGGGCQNTPGNSSGNDSSGGNGYGHDRDGSAGGDGSSGNNNLGGIVTYL